MRGRTTKKVSIIVPVYNLENVLHDTLDSIINQTYEDVQIILVNDGSRDDSGKICEEYAQKDERVLVINKENGGVSSARNLGISYATGDFVMFVDGDDTLEPDAVESMLGNIEENDSDMCICSDYFVNNDINRCAIGAKKEDVYFKEKLVKLQLLFSGTASLWLCMMKRNAVENVRFDEKIHALEDWKFIFDVFVNGVEKVSLCRKPLYHYMVREGSASHSSMNDRKMSCFDMTEDVIATVREKYPQYSEVAKLHDVRLLTHVLVLAAQCSSVDKKYNDEFKKIARRKLFETMKSKFLSRKKKTYVLMTAISPKLYYFFYGIKHKKRKV